MEAMDYSWKAWKILCCYDSDIYLVYMILETSIWMEEYGISTLKYDFLIISITTVLFCFPLFLWHVESFMYILNWLSCSFMCKSLDIHWSFVRLHIYIMIISLLLIYIYIIISCLVIYIYYCIVLYCICIIVLLYN